MTKKALIISGLIILALVIALILLLVQPFNSGKLGYQIAIGLLVFTGLFLVYRVIPHFFLALIPIGIVVGNIFEWPLLGHVYEVTFSEILIVAVFALFLVDKITRSDWRFDLTPTGLAFLAYLGLMAASWFWAESTLQVFIALRVFFFHFLTFFLTVNILTSKQSTPRDDRSFLSGRGRVLLITVPLIALAITAQLVWKLYDLRVFELLYIPVRENIVTAVGKWVTISAIIVLTVPVVYSLSFVFKNLLAKVALWCTAIFAMVFSLFTLGKGEAISLLGGLITFAKLNAQKRAAIFFTLLIVTAIILIPLSAVSDQLFGRLAETFETETTSFRLHEYSISFTLIADHWWSGVGAGNLKEKFIDYGLCDCVTESNNYLLQVFTELGIAGLVVFGFIVKTYVDLFRKLKKSRLLAAERVIVTAFLAAAIVALVNGFVEVTFWGLNYGIIWWYFSGLLWGLYLRKIRAKSPAEGNI